MLLGAGLSLAIEVSQYFAIAGRDASLSDLITNTLGTAVGALLAGSWRAWMVPGPRTARLLAAATALTWLMQVAVTGAAVRPALPATVYWGQRAADLAQFDTFPGRLLDARVGAHSLPSHRLPNSAEVRRSLMAGEPLTAVAEPAGATRGLAPLASIFDDGQQEIAVLGQWNEDLVFRLRSLALSLELRPPAVRLPWAFRARGRRDANRVRGHPGEPVRRRGSGRWPAGVAGAASECSMGLEPAAPLRVCVRTGSAVALGPLGRRLAGAAWFLAARHGHRFGPGRHGVRRPTRGRAAGGARDLSRALGLPGMGRRAPRCRRRLAVGGHRAASSRGAGDVECSWSVLQRLADALNSFIFIFAFLPVAYAVFWLLRTARQPYVWLTLTGYVFYGYWDPRFCLLMAFSTLVSYSRRPRVSADGRIARQASCASSFRSRVDLLLLGFFKYANFVLAVGRDAAVRFGRRCQVPQLDIVLPIGISFYTFHTISYIVDCYRGVITPDPEFLRILRRTSRCFPSSSPGRSFASARSRQDLEALGTCTTGRAGCAAGVSFFVVGLVEKVLDRRYPRCVR